MSKKDRKYFLLPTEVVVSETGISMYSLVREGDFSRDITQKYHNDVKDVINLRLEKMVKEYAVPVKDVNRIKELISELVHTKEILVTYDFEKPIIQKILDK